MGASSGSGSTIAQTLTATGNSSGTATYTITPTFSGCPGSPIIVVVTVQPCIVKPKHFTGKIKYTQFATQVDIVHLLSWNPSPDLDVIGYKVFQDHKLIKIIDKRNADRLELHNRKKNKVYHYKIVAFTATGAESRPMKLNL